jgi:hypothetical protein
MQLEEQETTEIFDEEVLSEEEMLAERLYLSGRNCRCGDCMSCLGLSWKDFF